MIARVKYSIAVTPAQVTMERHGNVTEKLYFVIDIDATMLSTPFGATCVNVSRNVV